MSKSKHPKPASGPGSSARKAGSPPASSQLTRSKKWLFSLVGFVVLPLFLLSLLELALRVCGYGYSAAFFRPVTIQGEKFLIENEKFGWRFFPPSLSRSPAPVRMRAHKEPGTIRIFIFGESAALGDPRPAYGAGRYLQALLRARYPQTRFEVVTTAMTAINSHAILPIARECARYDGDAWIVYMGNNEMVGPFGATTVFGSRAPPLTYARFSIGLQKFRLGQLLLNLARTISGRSGTDNAWRGMQMFMANQVPPGDSRKQTIYRNFEHNLADVLRAGNRARVPLLLSTVAVNLKDCAPFASYSNTNRADAAAAQAEAARLLNAAWAAETNQDAPEAKKLYQHALAAQPEAANIEYRLGKCLLGSGETVAAREQLENARDHDALPFRADREINKIVRQQKLGDRAALVDFEQLLGNATKAGVPGAEFFYEHVHLNCAGNYLLGRAWAGQIARLVPSLSEGVIGTSNWASQEECDRRLGLTIWNYESIVQDLLRRLSQPPFINQMDHAAIVSAVRAEALALRRQMTPEAAAQARTVYTNALREAPDDHRLHENFAEFLEATGDLAGSAREWLSVRDLIPQHHVAWFQAGRVDVRQGKLEEGKQLISQALEIRPDLAEGWLELGRIAALEGDHVLALKYYERERRLVPEDERVHYHIGKSLSALKRQPDAIASLRQAVRLRPSFWEAHYALGEELAFAGNAAEARREFEETVRLNPRYAMAQFNLGVCLFQQHEPAAALARFEETQRLDPTNRVAAEYVERIRKALQNVPTVPLR